VAKRATEWQKILKHALLSSSDDQHPDGKGDDCQRRSGRGLPRAWAGQLFTQQSVSTASLANRDADNRRLCHSGLLII